MSLVSRQPRPLRREEARYRDDRLFIIACDDTYAPKQYFDFFQIPRIQVHVVSTEDGTSSAEHVLERLLGYEYDEGDERWLLLDTDHYIRDGHFASFSAALTKARQHDVNIALSKPCFELWLLLHHIDETAVTNLANAAAVEVKLRAVLGEYNKMRLKAAHFPIETILDAYERAKRQDATVGGGDRPDGNTSWVYLLWESIISKALPSQLPEPLNNWVFR
jgi:hypothetical protein